MGRKSGRKSSRRKTRLRTFGARYVDTFQLRDIRTVRERATRVWAAESILMTRSPYGAPSKNNRDEARKRDARMGHCLRGQEFVAPQP